MEKWYCYRRKDGSELRRNRRSLSLWLKGYRLIKIISIQADKKV